MEQLLSNLLLGDNEIIEKATQELNEAFKHPDTISALCDVVVNSGNPQLRQYAATILRKRLGKLRNWQTISFEQQQLIKSGMLQAVSKEPEKSVRNAITLFIGVLVNHEFPKKDAWTADVLKFIFENSRSNDPHLSELGSQTFATLTDVAADQFIPHLQDIGTLCTEALLITEQTGNMATPVLYNILVGMGNLVPYIIGHNAAEHVYQNSIPYILKALHCFAQLEDPDKFINSFDVLENLADDVPKLLTPHIKLLVDFSLELSRNKKLDEAVRVKAIAYLGWLVRLKKKVILKQKLVDPIILALFEIMCEPSEETDDESEEYFGSNENSSPTTTATQTLDTLALNIPPKHLIPQLLQLLDPALKSNDPLQKKAAYLCIAVIAEGCSEAICNKYLRPLLDVIKTGITDQNPMIRNSALFALGQFSEFLQPEISQHSDEILPILFEYLQHLSNQIRTTPQKEPKHIDRVFYALETFCESLEDALVPHLPILMERLYDVLAPTNSVHLRELALMAVSATANAAKSNMLPYFQRLIEGLKMYLVKTEDKDICTLRPTAIDTLAALARTIGKENFLPLAADTLNLGMTLIEDGQVDDPELKRSCYNLFSSLASVVGVDMGAVLPKIVTAMIESVKSTDSIVSNGGNENEEIEETDENQDQEIDLEATTDEAEDNDDLAVNNAYMEEKEEAIIALKELAEHTGASFAPYIQTCFEEIYKLLNYPNEDIRQSSVEALSQFIIALYRLNNIEGVKQGLLVLIPKFCETIHVDEERIVVMAALSSFNEILTELGSAALDADGQKDAIFTCIQDVLNNRVACQFDEPVDEEQEESEYDEAILEQAGEILPKFGKALKPEEFALYFGRIFQFFIGKIEKSKQKDETTDSQRAFAVGILSECFGGLKEYSTQYFDSFLQMFLSMLSDRSDEVRNNAVYGLGELVLNSDQASYKSFPIILESLSNMVAKEQHPGILDNILGSLARMILTNSSLIPLKDVLPVFVQYLPLRQDFEENEEVYKALDVVYRQGNQDLLPLLERCLQAGLEVLRLKQYSKDECRDQIFAFVRQIRQDFPEKFNNVVNSNPDIAIFVQSL